MPDITLNADQYRVYAEADGPVSVVMPDGRWVGSLDPRPAIRVVQDQARVTSPILGFTAAQLADHLLALQAEWDRLGGYDVVYGLTYLQKLRAA